MFSERNTSGPLALFLFPDFKFWTALRNVPLHMSRDTHSEFSHQEIHSRLESIPRKRRDITHARLLYSCSQLFLRPRLIAPRGQQSVSTTCTNHREPLSWILVDLHGPILSKFAMCGQILGKFPNMEFYEISSDGSRAVGTGTASGQDRQRDRWTVMTDLKYKTLKQNRHCERSEASSPGRSLTKPPGDHSVHMSTWYTAAQRLSRALSLCLSRPLFPVCWIDVVTKTTKITWTWTGRRSPVPPSWMMMSLGVRWVGFTSEGTGFTVKGGGEFSYDVCRGMMEDLMKETAIRTFLHLSCPHLLLNLLAPEFGI